MVVAQHDGAVEQGETDPQPVRGDKRQERPPEHAFEQVVQRAEQQTPQPVPVTQDGFRLAVEGPHRADRHIRLLSFRFDASAIRSGTALCQGKSYVNEEGHVRPGSNR